MVRRTSELVGQDSQDQQDECLFLNPVDLVNRVKKGPLMHVKLFFTLLLAFAIQSTCTAGDWNNVQSWVYLLTNYKDDKLDELKKSDVDLAVIDLRATEGAHTSPAKKSNRSKHLEKLSSLTSKSGRSKNIGLNGRTSQKT